MKILVIKPSSLGDVVHALRVVTQIKSRYPNCSIDWVIKKGLEGILESSGLINQYYFFERGKGLLTFLRLIFEIRKKNYDFVLDLQGLLRSGFLTKASKGKRKLGRADGREGATLFYKSVGERNRKKAIHAIERLMPFLKELGVVEVDIDLLLPFNGSALANHTKQLLAERKFILLFPESRREEKVWPYFMDLALQFKANENLEVVIAGNEKETDYPDCLDLRTEIPLKELPALIKSAEMIISNDSAPLHIGSAMQKPLISLFGPTNPSMYGPYPMPSTQAKVVCSPSGEMGGIQLDDILRSIRLTLDQS